MSKFVVNLYDTVDGHSTRGPGTLKASIHDAKDIGISAYANESGEAFFTLPWDHPAADQIVPWQRHYQVLRYSGSSYAVMGSGLLNDFEANRNEVTAYGIDYLGLLQRTITGSTTSYANTLIGTIIGAEFTNALTLTDGPWQFIHTGTIDATTKTTTVISAFQPRLAFMQDLLAILMDGTSTRPHISVDRDSANSFSFNFSENDGSDLSSKRLVFGHNVNDFDYQPGYAALSTDVYAIGQRREGATVLYSSQTYASSATYGRLQTGRVFIDIINQTALNNKTLTEARRLARIPKALALRLAQQALVPWDGFDLTDSFPVYINRGLAAVNTSMTLWGLEWVGKKNGSEDLFLDLQPKET